MGNQLRYWLKEKRKLLADTEIIACVNHHVICWRILVRVPRASHLRDAGIASGVIP